MLRQLSIKNYAIIEELEISFSEKLTTITGETGAGKSILMGALSLILGERADSSVLYNKEEKCFVEGHFEIGKYLLEDFFQKYELDYEHLTAIRREITPNGKSRAFINDTPVTLDILKALSEQLVDVHSQHEMLDLNTASFQLMVIDSLAKQESLLQGYQKKFRKYQMDHSDLQRLMEQNKKSQTELDYFHFQFNELSDANLKEEEQKELEQELTTLNNSEEIKKILISAVAGLSENEMSVNNKLRAINSSLHTIKKFNPRLDALCERMQSSWIDLEDVTNELEAIEQSTVYDETKIEEITERLDLIYRLEKKHNVPAISQLLEIKTELDKKINSITSLADEIADVEKKMSLWKKELTEMASKISENRKKQIPKFEKQVHVLLHEVGMPYAQLKVKQETLDEIHPSGMDRIQILFASNKGSDFQEIRKIASGGELSRLMLSIKSLIADTTALPTLIFDEIDTGVSGEVAFKVGHLLEKLSDAHQVISITHLPQIAGKGDFHFVVFKEIQNKRTVTKVKKLSALERVVEIAKMIGGEKPSDAALKSAKELIEN